MLMAYYTETACSGVLIHFVSLNYKNLRWCFLCTLRKCLLFLEEISLVGEIVAKFLTNKRNTHFAMSVCIIWIMKMVSLIHNNIQEKNKKEVGDVVDSNIMWSVCMVANIVFHKSGYHGKLPYFCTKKSSNSWTVFNAQLWPTFKRIAHKSIHPI